MDIFYSVETTNYISLLFYIISFDKVCQFLVILHFIKRCNY